MQGYNVPYFGLDHHGRGLAQQPPRLPGLGPAGPRRRRDRSGLVGADGAGAARSGVGRQDARDAAAPAQPRCRSAAEREMLGPFSFAGRFGALALRGLGGWRVSRGESGAWLDSNQLPGRAWSSGIPLPIWLWHVDPARGATALPVFRPLLFPACLVGRGGVGVGGVHVSAGRRRWPARGGRGARDRSLHPDSRDSLSLAGSAVAARRTNAGAGSGSRGRGKGVAERG